MLGGCGGVRNADIRALVLCGSGQTLTRLSLRGTGVSDATLQLVLAECPNLMCLDAQDCAELTDQAVYACARHTKLVDVSFQGCRQITSAAIHFLRGSQLAPTRTAAGRRWLTRVNRRLLFRLGGSLTFESKQQKEEKASGAVGEVSVGSTHDRSQNKTQMARRLAALCNPHRPPYGSRKLGQRSSHGDTKHVGNGSRCAGRSCCSVFYTGFSKAFPQYLYACETCELDGELAVCSVCAEWYVTIADAQLEPRTSILIF